MNWSGQINAFIVYYLQDKALSINIFYFIILNYFQEGYKFIVQENTIPLVLVFLCNHFLLKVHIAL